MTKELKLGLMSINELAEWANVKESTIAKNKTKWCATKLAKYAEYELVRGKGVNILYIIEPIYSQKPKE